MPREHEDACARFLLCAPLAGDLVPAGTARHLAGHVQSQVSQAEVSCPTASPKRRPSRGASRRGDRSKGPVRPAPIVGSCIFLFWNEGRAVQTERSLTEGASLVVSVDPARVDPANDGKLVHLSGDLKPGAPLTDPDFTVSATALRLVRKVEMYQWKEETKTETRKNVRGSEETITTYEYVRTWSDSRIDFEPLQAAGRPHQSADAIPRRVLFIARRDARRLPPRYQCHRPASREPERTARPVAGGEAGGPRQRPGARCRWAHLCRREPVAAAHRRPAGQFPVGAGRTDQHHRPASRNRLRRLPDPGRRSAADGAPGHAVRGRHVRRRAAREPLPDLDFAVRRRVGDVHRLHDDFPPLVVVADVVPFIGNILSAGPRSSRWC